MNQPHAGAAAPLTSLQLAYLVGRESPVLGGTGCWLCWEFERAGWDMQRLEHAWNELVQRHETLRTVFAAGGSKVLDQVPPYAIDCLDLRHERDDVANEKLAQLREQSFHARTDPGCWPLFRIAAARTTSGMRLFTGFDMLIIDAAGIFRLLGELARLHDDPSAGLTVLAGRPQDAFTAFQERIGPHGRGASVDYWMGRLDQLPRAPSLPESRVRSGTSRFHRHEHRLAPAAWEEFQRRAAARGLQRTPALVAAFGQVLARWSTQRRFSLNLTSGKHMGSAIPDGVLGEFTSSLLLAVDFREPRSFGDRVRAVAAQLAVDLQHVGMGGVDVIAALSRHTGEQLVMPVVFSSLLHRHADLGALGRFVTGLTRTPQVTIDCQVMHDGRGLYLSWDVLEGHFPEGLTASMFESWVTAIEDLARGDAAWEAASPCRLPADQRARREAANATRVEWPAETLHGPVLAQARRTPDAVAVVTDAGTLSYRELAGRAAALASALTTAGAQRNELVAIVLEKGWPQVVAALAVQLSGAAYLPIDRATPPARIAELLRLGGCRLAVAEADVPLGAGILRIEADHPPLASWDDGPATPDDLAYVIFTSGSTGTPKGVMIRHRAAANTVRDVNTRFLLGPGDRVIGLSSLTFDLSVWDVFGALSAGAALVLPLAGGLRDPDYLKGLVHTHGVTVWNSVPAHLQMLAEHGNDHERLRTLRLAMLSGDWIPVSLPGRLAVPVVSLGGATEASIWSIAHPVAAVAPGWSSIPYGKPLANQQFHVLDDCMEDCPDGIAGELYIGGAGLADGYWRDEARTAASFVRHPGTGERLYRTGDWGRYLADGSIEFLGRRDGQVKIAGHRVELGEVEAAMGRCEGVDAAVAVTFTDGHGQKRLAAFYSGGAAAGSLRSQLQQRLPAYMVPLRLTALAALPLTANGKVDRATLAERAVAPPPAPAVDRLLNDPGVLRDATARQALVARRSAIREDILVRPAVPLRAAHELRAVRLKSVRAFAGVVALGQLESLLAGLRAVEIDGRLQREYPSAGDSYSVQVYVQAAGGRVDGLEGGLYYYHPVRHQLLFVDAAAAVDSSIHVPANQRMAAEAAFMVMLFADLSAVRPLYGDMAEPFAWMEAGHMTQILRQCAADCGLGLCLVGAYDAAPVLQALALGEQHLPLAAMVGGMPARDAGQASIAPGLHVARPPVAAAAAAQLEQRIAAIWAELLELPAVGLDERFFEIGGTSFSMLAVQRLLAQRLDREVSITDLFRYTTVSQLAAHLAAGAGAAPAPAAAPAATVRVDDELGRKRELRRALRRQAQSPPP